ncbi:MAG: zf-HC2 domain-containing protein [Dehalobacterium sp.]
MCRMDLNLLQDYIDGTIDPLERVVLEEHLRVCPDCRKELNRLKIIDWDLKNYFSDDKAVSVPDELAVLRDASISLFLSEEREDASQVTEEDSGKIGFKDVLSLQVSNLNNSLRYINILTGFNREEKTGRKTKQKKKSLFRKIIGM